jgi:hypothetical protein
LEEYNNMNMEESEKLILDNVVDELTIVLEELLSTGKINDSTIDQLEDVYEELKNIKLDELDEADAKKVTDKLKIIDLVLKKHREQYDNTTLLKITNYLTPSQIYYLDKVAEEHGLSKGNKRAGSRSAALRFILDQIKKND